jgi:hypothetical protein
MYNHILHLKGYGSDNQGLFSSTGVDIVFLHHYSYAHA